MSIRNDFLTILRREQVDASIYLINGIKLQGKIEAFDDDTVMLKNTITQIVLKHAISTVVPSSNLDLSELTGG